VPDGTYVSRGFGADGWAEGSTGCHAWRAEYSENGAWPGFGSVFATRKGCAGELAAVEEAVLAALEGATGYSLDDTHGGGLMLRLRDGGAVTLRPRIWR
jgi:heat shock protein HslJ